MIFNDANDNITPMRPGTKDRVKKCKVEPFFELKTDFSIFCLAITLAIIDSIKKSCIFSEDEITTLLKVPIRACIGNNVQLLLNIGQFFT